MPANHQRPAAQTPASPRNISKYTNKDGSKFITVPKGTSESSQPSTPTSAKQVDLPSEAPAHDDNAAPAINRKKQKRRQKAAAKAAAEQAANGHQHAASDQPKHSTAHPSKYDFANSEDDEGYEDVLGSGAANGDSESGFKSKKTSKKSKKKKSRPDIVHPGHHSPIRRPSTPHMHTPLAAHRESGMSREKIWSTNNQEERERIKEFWLGLGEDERKSLVKVEKDAVLKKMKEQQKHTCSCTVCGRKRTAIEEELEGLYDAYYVELEEFANQGGAPPLVSTPRDYPFRGIHPPYHPRKPPSRGRIVEHVGDEDDEDDLDDAYSENQADDDDYSDEEPPEEFNNQHDRDMADFLTFGNSLQVKGTQLLESFLRRYGNMDLGGILTVADDLLKNDGKRFIEMMEQLAERRMAREEDAREHFTRGYSHPNGSYSNPHANPPPPPDEDEYEEDDEEDEDYDDSQEDEYEDEEVLSNPSMIPSWSHTECCCQDDPMTEEQRMEEGRRMFQIFAARMFEQRVLSAYKEKVAKERQAQLIEELEEENRKEDEQKAKKAKTAQKKKEKAAQKKQAAAEEKARREAEKIAEEAERIETEQRRADQQRQKAEERKKQKEAQKKAEEDSRLKKEAERQRRLNEQREKQAEQERKAREAKDREKKLKDEQRLKEKEAREQKEYEATERKEKQARDKREKEARAAKAQKEAQEAKEAKEKAKEERAKDESLPSKGTAQPAQPAPLSQPSPSFSKRVQQPLGIVPTVLPQHPSNPANAASPKVPAVLPSLSKAPTPIRSRALSQQHDYTQQGPGTSQASSATSQNVSPYPESHSSPGGINQHRRESGSITTHSLSASPHHAHIGRQSFSTPVQGLPPLPMQPPPGLSHHALPPGFPGQLGHDQMMPPGVFRPPGGMLPPPGITAPLGRGFAPSPMVPPGFPIGHIGPNQGFPLPQDVAPLNHPTHARQGSASFDAAPGTPTQPIARPAPIGRPGTISQGKRGQEKDDETQHLGSRALLEDDEEPVGSNPIPSSVRNQPPGPRLGGFGSSPFMDSGFGLAHNPWGPPTANPFSPPGLSSHTWGVPGIPPTFGLGSPGPPIPSRPSQSSPAVIRSIIVQGYKDLSAAGHTDTEGYVHLHSLKARIESQHLDHGLSDQDILDLSETEGSATNGGGTFESRIIRGTPTLRWQFDEGTGRHGPHAGPISNPNAGSAALGGL